MDIGAECRPSWALGCAQQVHNFESKDERSLGKNSLCGKNSRLKTGPDVPVEKL